MKTKKELKEIVDILRRMYPDAKGSLDFNSPFQITIAVLLSAQCTDKRVNIVTKKLFADCPDLLTMEKLSVDEIEKYIQSINFYSNKAKHIYNLCQMLKEKFNSNLPNNIEDLQKLPGIGRKCANIIMLEGFNNPQGIAIDTHAKRICNRLDIISSDDPLKIEKELVSKLDKTYYYDLNHLFVYHGREICKAKNPLCNKCKLRPYCKYVITNI